MTIGAYKSSQSVAEDPRAREYRLFIQVTAALEDANEDEDAATSLGHALHENRRLWNALMADLSTDGNALPDDLKAQIISLGIWVNRHSSAVLKGDAAVKPLIDVNRIIIQGLAQRPEAIVEYQEAVGGTQA
jgi:flagellar protein FlaF